jgi:hypothetical protein
MDYCLREQFNGTRKSYSIETTTNRSFTSSGQKMASTPNNGNATTKKRKIKQLPNGLSQLTESNFRKVMAFRLETDSHKTGEVMVAYKATMANANNSANSETFDLEKLTLDQPATLQECWRSICQQMRQISVQEGTVDSCKSPGPEGKGRCMCHHCIGKDKQQHCPTFAM